jgi:hypothetical protein
MQVLGLCRMSYPAIGGFQTEQATIAERVRFLYAPERMAARLRAFEAFTLPSLKAQTDPDFTLVVVIGDDLPARWRDRIEGLLSGLPQAVIRALPPGRHRRVMQEVINEARDGRPCLQFRIDDDDAVSVAFVEQARAAAADAAGLLRRHRMVAIDFTRGHSARPCAAGIEAEAVVRQFWAQALVVAVAADERLTVMNFNHMKLWQFMPALSLTEPDMFVRGLNDWNDSDVAAGPGARLLDAEGEALFRRAYGICADRVRALYAEGG